MIVKFKKKDAETKLPIKGSLFAAAYDVYVHSLEFPEEGVVVYHLGFSTDIPVGYRGVLVPRSNLSKTKWVMGNSIGIIDSDYRGEWMMKLRSLGSAFEMPPYTIGERCAQIYFEKVLEVEFEEIDELSDTERGEGGFGSTGLK
jgi:dUTP pyrophosphatase